MAFGIPGSESSGDGEFLGRIQYDARVGFWKVVKRVQQSDGGWVDQIGDDFKNPTMLFDLATLEVGYIKFASPPAFLVVPYGRPIPQQPEEMTTDQNGKKRKSFLPGFRMKVMSPKTFGDAAAYYFAHNAKTVMEPMDELYQLFEQAPEAAAGQIPLVEVTGTRIVEIKSSQGTNRYHAPVFAIRQWMERPEAFGERTIPAPVKTMTERARGQYNQAHADTGQTPGPVASPAISTMPPTHVAQMAAASVPQPQPVSNGSAAAPVAGMPFAPQVD